MGDDAGELDLLVTACEVSEGAAVRPGARWTFPAPAEAPALVTALPADGWNARRHEAGMAFIEATKPGSAA